MRLSMSGIALGLASAFALTRVMRGMLVGVAPTDPMTFVAVALLFCVIAALACWLPARRAAGLDPLTALRDE
jgi:ABC-type antimicrobial peptide transport system permease subunit